MHLRSLVNTDQTILTLKKKLLLRPKYLYQLTSVKNKLSSLVNLLNDYKTIARVYLFDHSLVTQGT